ncbi:transposable element Tcb1 transposase [Trichonephila clavipes]|nr:transposable element Tcb1 transposase [Trichonephila clavipes]
MKCHSGPKDSLRGLLEGAIKPRHKVSNEKILLGLGSLDNNSNPRIYMRREIGSRVGRNQTTVMRICDRWMQEGTTDQHGRSQPPQCTTSREDRQIVLMAVTNRSVTSRTIA